MTEVVMWGALKAALARGWGHRGHAQRIENAISSGAFDVEMCLEGRSFWLELKFGHKPVKAFSKLQLKIRESQIHWFAARRAAGGAAAFMIRIEDHLYLVTDPALVIQLYRREITLASLAKRAAFITGVGVVDYIAALRWCRDHLIGEGG